MLAGNELRQIARLLVVVAVAHDLVDAQVGMRAIREPDRARRARHLLHRHAVLEVAQAEPAIFLRRGDPVQAERAHLGPEIAGKAVVAVDRRGARRDLLLGEGSGALADHLGAFAEVEVEATGRVGDHSRNGRLRKCGQGDLGRKSQRLARPEAEDRAPFCASDATTTSRLRSPTSGFREPARPAFRRSRPRPHASNRLSGPDLTRLAAPIC